MAPSQHMQRALELAAAQVGRTSPNPVVGCVLVRGGVAVGEGAFEGPLGSPHAERRAIAAAGEAARGATAYVTLEPCSHHGRTPPCTDALIEAGVARVVFALIDPDARVSGQGQYALEQAGIAVEVGDGGEEASRLLEAYIKHRTTGLPFVTVKYAASMDGRIAAASGDSRWVSGPETLRWAHEERPKLDAMLIGASTVVVDNPQLTARPGGVLADRQPLRVVLDSKGRITPDRDVLQGDSKTLVATTAASSDDWRRSIESTGADVLVFPPDENDRVALLPVLEHLGGRGIVSLLVEGGGVVIGSFFDNRLVDKVTAVIAPLIIGARGASNAVEGRGAYRMADAVRLRDVTTRALGDDTLITGYPVYPPLGAPET